MKYVYILLACAAYGFAPGAYAVNLFQFGGGALLGYGYARNNEPEMRQARLDIERGRRVVEAPAAADRRPAALHTAPKSYSAPLPPGRAHRSADGLSTNEQRALAAVCNSVSWSELARCREEQLRALRTVSFRPDLARFSADTQAVVSQACVAAIASGPAGYNTCLARQLQAHLLQR